MKRFVATIFVAGLFLSHAPAASAAVNLKNYRPRLESAQAPQLLFRWVNPYWLERTDWSTGRAIQQFPKVDAEYVRSVKDLLKLFSNRVAFSWVDPVLGSHGVLHEHYGGPRAQLIVIEIQPDAKAIRFIHETNDTTPLRESVNVQELRRADLIEHVTQELHEWIIVNPKAIRAYTLDPKITFPIWKRAFRPFLQDAHYVPPLEKIHFRSQGQSLPVWRRNSWDQSVFFGNQFFAFQSTPGHPWYQPENPSSRDILPQAHWPSYGDLRSLTQAACSEHYLEAISVERAMNWYRDLR